MLELVAAIQRNCPGTLSAILINTTRMKKPPRKRTADARPDRTFKKPRLSRFTQALLHEWKRLNLPTAKASVVVAVSGGADSVALLVSLDALIKSGKLNLNLQVAHLNHRLRGKTSEADARWVMSLAKRLGRAAVSGTIDVNRRAAKTGDNLEQAARRARYGFLEKTARGMGAKLILTGHTMDDQAETVLLNLLRGSGAGGLGGVDPVRPIALESDILLGRPLLSWALRQDTENYCRQQAIEFRTDEMNLNEKFARVRVRRQLLPLMQTFNPKVVAGLSRTAELLREDTSALNRGAVRLLELSLEGETGTLLRFDLLAVAPTALRRRALRLWIEQCRGDLRRLERIHLVAVERLVLENRGGRVIELPGGARISRKRGLLQFID